MSGAIAVFAKTPGLSPVKTRLARDIGVANAQAFYRLSVAAVSETVSALVDRPATDLKPHWAVAEAQAVGRDQWSAFPAIWTGEGSLGDRLHAVYSTLIRTHAPVVLIGTDSPQLTPAAIAEAVGRLGHAPGACVIGPALDGGFYLFGAGIPLAADIWTRVAYSEATTLDELVVGVRGAGTGVEFLAPRTDTDTLDDLAVLLAELDTLGSLSRSQTRLREWLQAFLGRPTRARSRDA